MRKHFYGLLVCVVVAGSLHMAQAQQERSATTSIDTTRIVAFLQEQMQRDGIPGLAISITNRDRLLYAAGLGDDGETAIHPEQAFMIGSLSKAFTATAVMRLVEAKRVALDSPVARYLPAFAPRGAQGDVTVRHLSNQRSGFERRDGFSLPGPAGAVERDLAYEPGTAFSYSNLNYSLLGQVVEQASGMPYASYMAQHVFQPLGMHTAAATAMISEAEPLVQGRQFLFWPTIDGKTPQFAPEALPAGFIRASVLDMAAFLRAHLRADSTSGLGVSPEGFRALHTPPDGQEYGYAMGWVRGGWTGTPSLQHSGLTASYSSVMVALPEVDLGVTILMNANSFTAKNHLMDGVLRILREQETVRYARNERWLRLALLGAFTLGFVGFARRMYAWQQAGFPVGFSSTTKNVTQFGVGMAVNGALLFGIPWYMDVPLTQVPHLQPDLGYALILGVGVGVLDSVLKAFLFER